MIHLLHPKHWHKPQIPPVRDQVIFWTLAVVGVIGDLWSKATVFKALGPNEKIDLIPGLLRFVLALNDGAAFSMARGQRPFLVGVSVVAWIVIVCVFYWNRHHTRLTLVALGMFAGGILGNLYDRAFREDGCVRDFIDAYIGSYHWPTFNVADSLLCIAVGLLMISSLFHPHSTEKVEPEADSSQNKPQ